MQTHTPQPFGQQHGRPTTGARETRIDAHCHSKASSGPAVKALGYLGVPECYSEPEAVYDLAMRRGMHLVTLTDHDTISGGLELLNRGFANVVLGEEVTVHFPEDRCKLHVLVWCLTPEQHEEIGTLKLRDDVYEFASWLHHHNLPHSLAHPLYEQNHTLSLWHIERCALLFKGFEVLNGAHAPTHKRALEAYLAALSPGRMHRMIEEQQLTPAWNRAWEKATTGGSDDHGLLNVGRTWTKVTEADALDAGVAKSCFTADGVLTCPREFFRVAMLGKCGVGGEAGHSALLAHQLTTVGAHYYARVLAKKSTPTGRHVAGKLLRFAGASVPKVPTLSLALHAAKRKLSRKRNRLDPVLMALKAGFAEVSTRYPDLVERLDPSRWAEGTAIAQHDRMATFSDDLYEAMHKIMASGALRALREKDQRELVDHLLSYLVLELTQLPTLFSLFHQNKERRLVEHVEHHAGASPLDRPMRVMLFTDTLGDVNGVSRFIRNAADQALASGRDLTVVTSTNFEVPQQTNIINVAPVFATAMPKYKNLELVLPPLVKMLRLIDKMQPDVVHISTPGSVGLVGFVAAKMLRVPLVGVYHTDFPAYVEKLFHDDSLTHACTGYMKLFYKTFAAIFTRSEEYKRSLEEMGLDGARIEALMPGIMTEEFHPRHKDESVEQRAGLKKNTVRVLFVGRVSVEKNMPMLARVWREASAQLTRMGVAAELVIIGDGPYREQMEKELRGVPTSFLGFRYGQELSSLYAGCDLFAFPSTTDTLGQVVMESQASGMPVLVSDQGGPKEVTIDGETGYVLPATDDRAWVDALVDLCSNHAKRQRMGHAAHEAMQTFSMARSFEHFWQVHEHVWAQTLAKHGITPRTPEQALRGVVEPIPTLTPSRMSAANRIAGFEHAAD
jgi:glycosyltransferase involved in cell wall biosynthesis/predicted metal-dependent phosphoesterase TrpH